MMQAQQLSLKTRENDNKINTLALVVPIFLLVFFVSFSVGTANASTGINKTINFQGKLTNSNGTNVADSTYSVVFTLYDASSGGTNLWDETQNVTTVDGTFQVALGSVDTTLGNVNFNSDTLYLGIKVGSDSEMTPRIRFSAVPYAFNASRLNGVTATQSASGFTLTGGTSTAKTLGVSNSLTFAGTDGTVITFQGTDTYVGLTTSDILTNKTIGSTGLIFSGATTDITTATNENFTLAPNGSGDTIFTSDADTTFLIGSSANTPAVLSISGGIGNNAALIVNNTNSGDLFVASASGTTKFIVSNTGAITSANYLTNTGVLYTDSTGLFQQTSSGSDGNCLVMSGTTPSWGSCITGGGMDGMSNVTYGGNSDNSFLSIPLNLVTSIATVSATPTTTTADVYVRAVVSLYSGSNTDQSVSLSLRKTSCSGPLLSSNTSTITLASGAFSQVMELSGVDNNPGTGTTNYVICESTTGAASQVGNRQVFAEVIDNVGPQGPEGPAGVSDWHVTSLGVLAPNNLTTDLLLGSTATETARFAVINVNSGTTTASISAGAAGGIYITAAGTITTTANQSLIIGNSTSGHVILNPLSRMYVGIGTTDPVATLDVRGTTGLAGGTVPVASLSGRTSFASLVVNNSGAGDLLAASSSGLSRFVIKQNGTIGVGVDLPTAMLDVSGTASLSSALTFRTGAGEIQTTGRNTLTVGGSTTGNIIIDSGSSSITLSDLTTATGGLTVTTGQNLTINGEAFTDLSGNGLVLSGSALAVLLTSSGTTGLSSSNSGLEVSSSGLTLLKGCNDGQILKYTDAGGWACTADDGSNWDIVSGTIRPKFASTLDFLLGGTTTTSAKFAVLNVNAGTPTATVAGNFVIQPYTSGTSQLGGTLTVGGVQGFANAIANFGGSVNGYLQVNNQNRSGGSSASTDFIATNDTGTDSTNYIDFGINSSGYNDAAYSIGGANDGYLYNNGGNLSIGTQTLGKIIKFHAGGTLAANEVFRMSGIATTATASVAAATTFAGFVADNRGSGDIFTASSSGLSRFVITQNGNVGIGTTNPSQKLDVNGNLRVQGFTNNNGVLYTDSTGLVQQTTTGGAGTLCLTSANGGTPVFGSCSGTASTVWSSLTSPAANLSLSMTTRTSTFNWATGTGSNNLFSLTTDNSSNGTGALLNLSTGASSTVAPLTISAAGKQSLYVNASGDIGVGTTTPLGTFDVRGSSGTTPAATVSANSSFAGLIVNNSGVGDLFTASSSGTTRLTVQQNGQIVIGVNGVGSQLVASNNGIEFTESDTNPTCAAGNYNIYADLSENKLKKCQNGTVTDLDPALANMQSFTTYDSSEALIAVPTTLVFSIATVSATPTSATGDVYVRGKAQLSSGSNTDQVFTMSLRKNTCSGIVISSNVITITSASGANVGDFELSGVDVNPGTGTTNYILCGSVTGAVTNIVWHEVFAQVVDNGADYAEFYTTHDETLAAGDVVALDSSLKAGVKKTQRAYDSGVMGIVATHPGQVIGGVDREGVNVVPIALAGRVPVKVSTENGAILPGDFLTASSIPGVAMKATGPGIVIGQAMTGYFESGQGTVMAFVRNQWYDQATASLDNITLSPTESSQSASLLPTYLLTGAAGEIITRAGAFAQATIGNVKIGYAEAEAMAIDGYLNVKENITAGIITTGEITTNSLIITSENVSIGGLTLRDYIASVVRDVLETSQNPHVQVATTTSVPGLLTQASGEKLFKDLLAENVLGASTSAALASAPDVSEIASSSAVANSDDLALKNLNVDGLATISSTLRVKQNGLVEGILTVVDTLMTKNIVVSGIATFFDTVIFKENVSFESVPTFNKDTAGFAIIKKDSDRVDVVFDKAYDVVPVVNATVSLDEFEKEINETEKAKNERQQEFEEAVLGSNISYIVTKRTKKGFTILLNKAADDDISFSWTAIAVDDPQTFESKRTNLLSPTPTTLEQSSSPAGDNLQGEEVIQHEGTH